VFSLSRKLFCEISPLTYRISTQKCILLRHAADLFSGEQFASERDTTPLPMCIYKHSSLIRRTLGQVDPVLQENKAVNLALAAPKVNGILIRPGETFSFWHLVGNPTAKAGYREGLTIEKGVPCSGIGGGMCQFTNLIHWMVLHTPLVETELHHHDSVDLFPDFGRKVPFGTGTSILYNYIDYRFQNDTDITCQLLIYLTDTHLCGELRAEERFPMRYHIRVEDEHFSRENGVVYRNGRVFRDTIDAVTGNHVGTELLRANHARVLYDTSELTIRGDEDTHTY
jgi:vancomycin resistance protein VanW